MTLVTSLRALCLSLAIFMLPACAQAQSEKAPANKAEIEAIVQDYLMNNPEIIRDALIALGEREKREQIQRVAKELRHDNRDFAMGPKDAKVTIVEFFDYNCSFCKKSTDWLQNVMVKYPKDVRVVFKELPILERRTRTSRNAARAALAAKRQGKYNEMHIALMRGGELSSNFINGAAKKMGLNMKKFEADMKDDAIEQQIEDAMELASRIPDLTGTPFFVINDQFLASGNTQALQALLESEL